MKGFTILKQEMTGCDFQLFCVCVWLVCVSLVSVVERYLVSDTTGLQTWKHVEKWALMHREEYYPCEFF